MLFRKIESLIEDHLQSDSKKILLIDGARQVGKTYIIRHVGHKLFENFIDQYGGGLHRPSAIRRNENRRGLLPTSQYAGRQQDEAERQHTYFYRRDPGISSSADAAEIPIPR